LVPAGVKRKSVNYMGAESQERGLSFWLKKEGGSG